MDELVSIIVPVYNAEKYLDRCLESILGQSYKNIELIIVDDGSTDQSRSVCERYAGRDSRVKLIFQEKKGVLVARLRGISESNGVFIAWADADDWMEKDYLEKLVFLQHDSDADLVAVAHFHDIGEDHAIVKNGISDGVYLCKEIFDRMLCAGDFFEYGITPQLYSKLFRAKILKNISEIDSRIIAGDDAAILYPVIAEADTICISGMSGYHYIQHASSITKNTYTREVERIEVLIEYLRKQFSEKHIISIMQKQLLIYRNYLLAMRQIDFFDKEEQNGVVLSPYGGIGTGQKVIIYGAGVLGQKIYRYLKKVDEQMIAAWVDKNYAVYSRRGLAVVSPEVIPEMISEIDCIVIANITEKIAESIRNYLLEMNVPGEKIRWFTYEFREAI